MIIYKITNKINDKIYIGQTIRSLEERVKEHKRKKNCSLYKAFNKYGIENFDFEIIEKCNSIEEMNEKEIYWIKYYDCLMPKGYNLCEGGGQTNGCIKDTHITRVCKGKRNKTGGYRWQYLEEYMAIPCQASEN